MKKNKHFINISIIIILFIALLTYIITVDGWANVVMIVKKIEPMWFALGFVCMLLYWLLEAFILKVVAKKFFKKLKFIDSFRVSMIGQLFNNITPFSAGGKPAEAYTMVKYGIDISSAASIILIKFVIFQFTLVVYTSIVMIFKFAYFNQLVDGFVTLSVVGFVVNLFVIISLIAIGINKDIAYNVLKPLYCYLDKLGLMKNLDSRLEKLKEDTIRFHKEFQIMKKEKIMIIKAFFLSFIQLTAFFMTAYMVYRAFGENSHSIFDIVAAQTFLMLIMSFIPTPGAGGAAEGGFYILFAKLFEKNEIKMAILFWRVYTFYLPIIIGSICMLFKPKKRIVSKDDIVSDEVLEEYINKES